MPNHLSTLGIAHTAVSVVALLFAFYTLLRFGKINPAKGSGLIYTILTVVACLSSLPVMKTGHFTGAHGLAVIILLIIPIAFFARSARLLGGFAKYVEIVLMSATVYLSMIPAIVETLTRLPVESPLAKDPADPMIKSCLILLTIIFIGGVTYQLRKIYSDQKVLAS